MAKSVKIYTPNGFLKNKQGEDFIITISKGDKFQDIFNTIQEETGCNMEEFYLLSEGNVKTGTDKVNFDVLRSFASHPHFSLYKRNLPLKPDVAGINNVNQQFKATFNDPENMEHQVASRKLGCLMGMYVGDALGAPFEFRRARKPEDVIGKTEELRLSEQKVQFQNPSEVAKAYSKKYPNRENPYIDNEYLEKNFNKTVMYSTEPSNEANKDILPMQGGSGGFFTIHNPAEGKEISVGYQSKWNTQAGSQTDDSSMGTCVLDWLKEKLVNMGVNPDAQIIDEAVVCQLFENLIADLKTDELADKLLDWMYTGFNSGLWAARAETQFDSAIIGCGATIYNGLTAWDKFRFAKDRPLPGTLLGLGQINDGNGSCIRVAPVPVFAVSAKEAFVIAYLQAKSTANGEDAAFVAALVAVISFKCINRPLAMDVHTCLKAILSDTFFKEFVGLATELGLKVPDNILKLLKQKEISGEVEADEHYLKWDVEPSKYQLHERKDMGYYGSYSMELIALIFHNLHHISRSSEHTITTHLLHSVDVLTRENAIDLIIHSVKSSLFQEGLEITVLEYGDADSNAAVMGTILGALCGFDSIPKLWLEKIMYRPLNEDPAKTPFSESVNFVNMTNTRQNVFARQMGKITEKNITLNLQKNDLETPEKALFINKKEEIRKEPANIPAVAEQPKPQVAKPALPPRGQIKLKWMHKGQNGCVWLNIVRTEQGIELHFPPGEGQARYGVLQSLLKQYSPEEQNLCNTLVEFKEGHFDIILFHNSNGRLIPGTTSYVPGCYYGKGLCDGINFPSCELRKDLFRIFDFAALPESLIFSGKDEQNSSIYLHPKVYSLQVKKPESLNRSFFENFIETLNSEKIRYALDINRGKFVPSGNWTLFSEPKEKILYGELFKLFQQEDCKQQFLNFFLFSGPENKHLKDTMKFLLATTIAEMYGITFPDKTTPQAIVSCFTREITNYIHVQALTRDIMQELPIKCDLPGAQPQ